MKRLSVGDKIKIVSFPRLVDHADGFAGVVGTVQKIRYDERFNYSQVGFINLKLDDGSTLIGVGVTNMKFEMVCEKL